MNRKFLIAFLIISAFLLSLGTILGSIYVGKWCPFNNNFTLTITNSSEFELKNVTVEFETPKEVKNNSLISQIAPKESVKIDLNKYRSSPLRIYVRANCTDGTQFLNKNIYSDNDEMIGFCKQGENGFFGPHIEIIESCQKDS